MSDSCVMWVFRGCGCIGCIGCVISSRGVILGNEFEFELVAVENRLATLDKCCKLSVSAECKVGIEPIIGLVVVVVDDVVPPPPPPAAAVEFEIVSLFRWKLNFGGARKCESPPAPLALAEGLALDCKTEVGSFNGRCCGLK